MGNKYSSCSCLKNNDEVKIEVSICARNSNDIQIMKPTSTNSIKKISIIEDPRTSQTSKILKDSTLDTNIYLNSILNKSCKNPEILIQALVKGVLFREKFNSNKGMKNMLKKRERNSIKNIEKNYIPKILLNRKKLFVTKNFKENWKKYYNEEEYNKLKLNNIEKNTNYNKYHIKTKCLITEYKGERCLYKGVLNINNNNFDGYGVLYIKSSLKYYEGNFINNDFTGWGRHINSKGICYEGFFIKNVLNGKGEIIQIDENGNKNIYKGDIINFKKEGKGIEKNVDFKYEGDFLNDIKNGKGKIIYYNTGDFYEGEFKNGEINGYGFYTWKNKHTYEGSFLNGKMHGKGIYKWPDGNTYEGEYKNNIKEGEGEFIWKDGRKFKGNFKNGRPNGQGFLTIGDIVLDAEFIDGKFVGDLKSEIGFQKIVNTVSNNNDISYE